MECKNCAAIIEGKFCSSCGQKTKTKRITFSHLIHEIPESIFQVETGLPFTVKGLFTRPAGFLRDYFSGKRVQYYKPLGYVILLSTISSIISYLVSLYLRIHYHPVVVEKKLEGTELLMYKSAVFFAQYNSVFYFLMIPIISLCSFLFFYKKYNYWEHFIANTYLTAQFNFLIVVAQLVRLFNHGRVNYTIFLFIFFTYISVVYKQLYNSPDRKGYWFKMAALMILIVFVYTTGLSLAGMMTPWWGTNK